MILPILHYGHPILRQKGARIQKVTDSIRRLAHDMIETMYKARGLGLAAQQVGQALQLLVIDVRGSENPSQFIQGGRDVPLDEAMPLILLNPEIIRAEGEEFCDEGCLSFPDISASIKRASTVHVSAMNLDGFPIQFVALGLLARAVQHEMDHLNGVLIVDRMEDAVKKPLEPALAELHKESLSKKKKRR
ncbi:MAG: peptide deformylase [Verrucomicrobiae bacterium]|nr:peptide deformylase [Verrucomicrobiae bacterium]